MDILGIVCRLRIDRWVLRAGGSLEGPAGFQACEEGCGRDVGMGITKGHGDNFSRNPEGLLKDADASTANDSPVPGWFCCQGYCSSGDLRMCGRGERL